MTSEIHWQTGTPTITGAEYIITDKHGHIETDFWSGKHWLCYNKEDVLAWCLLVDINPYKPIKSLSNESEKFDKRDFLHNGRYRCTLLE